MKNRIIFIKYGRTDVGNPERGDIREIQPNSEIICMIWHVHIEITQEYACYLKIIHFD